MFAALQYDKRSTSVLDDNIREISAILEIDLHSAELLVRKVLAYYHFQITPMPVDVPTEILELVVHVTQPFRLPHMTERMEDIVERLGSFSELHDVLDYGGGGLTNPLIFK